jgi:hypothetical protein
MPDILIRTLAIAANAVILPLDKDAPVAPWKFRRCPYTKGLYTFLLRSMGAVGTKRFSVSIGTTEVVQEGDMQIGLADGIFPTPAGVAAAPAHQFHADFNDEIVLTVKDVAGPGTDRVMIWANVEPA